MHERSPFTTSRCWARTSSLGLHHSPERHGKENTADPNSPQEGRGEPLKFGVGASKENKKLKRCDDLPSSCSRQSFEQFSEESLGRPELSDASTGVQCFNTPLPADSIPISPAVVEAHHVHICQQGRVYPADATLETRGEDHGVEGTSRPCTRSTTANLPGFFWGG